MDLTALYHLRDRLQAGAISGVGLIAEDFRLSRALEAFAPMEAASPVFAKLGQSARALLDPACPDRGGALLDALSLCDAVLTTQAAVAAGGELSPLPAAEGRPTLVNAPHSLLQPLIEALTTSGGGRFSFVTETHEQRPELFDDYRIKYALVQALGASYSELADLAAKWLAQDGPQIAPMLKRGFDPCGKKDMVRRIQVLEQVAGAGENEFYLSLLDTAEKEVRAAAIFALRHDCANTERLITLAKTEKGASKKMAHSALAQIGGDEAWVYWDALIAKKPEQALEYMPYAQDKRANEFVASQFERLLDHYEAAPDTALSKEDAALFQAIHAALPQKSGEGICAAMHRAATLTAMHDKKGSSNRNQYSYSFNSWEPLSSRLSQLLIFNLLREPTEERVALSAELREIYPARFAAPHVLAMLLTRPADEAYDSAKSIFSSLFGVMTKQELLLPLLQELLLNTLSWDAAQGRQVYRLNNFVAFSNLQGLREKATPLFAPLDFRWFETLLRVPEMAALTIQLRDPSDERCRKMLLEHFIQHTKTADGFLYLRHLRDLGATECDRLAQLYFQRVKKAYSSHLESFLDLMPGTNAQKAVEAEAVLKLCEQGKITFQDSGWRDRLLGLIAQYHAQPDSE